MFIEAIEKENFVFSETEVIDCVVAFNTCKFTRLRFVFSDHGYRSIFISNLVEVIRVFHLEFGVVVEFFLSGKIPISLVSISILTGAEGCIDVKFLSLNNKFWSINLDKIVIVYFLDFSFKSLIFTILINILDTLI